MCTCVSECTRVRECMRRCVSEHSMLLLLARLNCAHLLDVANTMTKPITYTNLSPSDLCKEKLMRLNMFKGL